MSQADLDRWYKNQREKTIVKLRQEVRALPTLDPGTDRPDDTEVWLAIARAQNAIMSILGMSDDELFRHTDDLRNIACALNQRITGMED